MEKLKEWAIHHKALAIGGGIALVVLLYLWFRSGSSSTTSPDQTGLAAYYAAQAGAATDAASVQETQAQLQAASQQTNAQEALGLAQVQAATVPYTSQLQVATLSANLTAYQDYLAELAGTGTAATSAIPPITTNAQTVQPGGPVWGEFTSNAGTPVLYQGIAGNPSSLIEIDPSSGAISYDNESQPNFAGSSGEPAKLVTWSGVPGAPPVPYVAPTMSTTAPLSFQQFIGQGGASASGTPQATVTTPSN